MSDSSCEILYGSSEDDSFHSFERQNNDDGISGTVPSTPDLEDDVLLPLTPSDSSGTSIQTSSRDSASSTTGNQATEPQEDKHVKAGQSSSTPLSSLPTRNRFRNTDTQAQVDKTQIKIVKNVTSTPLLNDNRKQINLDLDLTEIIEVKEEGGHPGHLNLTGDGSYEKSEESNPEASKDSICELLDDEDIPDTEEYSGACGSGTNQIRGYKVSPDIDAITEKLRNQHLGEKKPLTVFLENPPIPFQEKNKFEDFQGWRGSVAETISKIAKAIETMPATTGTENYSIPRRLRVELYPHQIYGAKWMWWREQQYPGGGILADEMGLGKTVISLALILMGKEAIVDDDSENWLSAENKKLVPTKSTLVICPVGCIGQWENELRTKARGLKVTVYHGSNRTKSAALLSQNDVVITSYPTVGSEVPKPDDDPYGRSKSPLLRLYWERVLLDEGHIIRNPKTLGAQAVCRLNARHRWVVTGTPVHNKAQDFFSLMKFLQLRPFDDPKVWTHWIGMKFVPESNKERLHTIGKAIILRRTKEDVKKAGGIKLSIPEKTVEDVELEMQESERAIYDHLENFAKQQFKNFLKAQADRQKNLQGAAYTFHAGKAKRGNKGDVQDPAEYKFSHMFALLTRLRQSSVLPFLIRTMLDDEEENDEASYDAFNDPVNAKNPIFEPGYKSSKIRAVMNNLKQLKNEAESKGVPMDKVIIVSQWTTLLDIISQHLKKKGFTFASITGADSIDARTVTMEKFNSNPKKPQILLLSIAAGGVGLNLVGANHVFFLEPHWNPQMERQAQDRVHRFGQTKPVFIKRFIVKDTIESRVLDLQAAKIELSDGLMDSTKKGTGAGLNVADMRKLFGV